MRRTRLGLALLALAGAAGAGVLTAEVDALEAKAEYPPELHRLPDEIPAYPDADYFPMGDELHVDGFAREMAYAVTADPVHKVINRYESIFTSRGFKVERHGSATEEWVIATDVADPTLRTVIATEAQGHTAIIASVRDKLQEQSFRLVDWPSACTEISNYGARDGRVLRETTVLHCAMPIDALLLYYHQRFPGAQRSALLEPTADAKQARISYRTKQREVAITASQAAGEPPVTTATVAWEEQR